MVETKNITAGYGRKPVVENITMSADAGEIVNIIGGSGCGKSTLLRAVMGLMPVMSGEIYIDGNRTDNLKEMKMNEVRRNMGMVFQEGALFDSMNVMENVAFALRRHTSMKESEIREVVNDRLEAVEMEGLEKKMPDELSGGQRRRVGIARALALHPKILLYDEPTTGLDPVLTGKVTELILKMRDRYNTTSIVVTHDMKVVENTADRIYMISEGKFIAEGTMKDLRSSGIPEVISFVGA